MTRIYHDSEPVLTICPWSYNICKATAESDCNTRARLKDCDNINKFTKITRQVWRCEWLGKEITREQHEHRRIGVNIFGGG
jgi:hypothetical protein